MVQPAVGIRRRKYSIGIACGLAGIDWLFKGEGSGLQCIGVRAGV